MGNIGHRTLHLACDMWWYGNTHLSARTTSAAVGGTTFAAVGGTASAAVGAPHLPHTVGTIKDRRKKQGGHSRGGIAPATQQLAAQPNPDAGDAPNAELLQAQSIVQLPACTAQQGDE